MLAMSTHNDHHKENSINRLTNAFQSISLGNKASQLHDSNSKKVIRYTKDKSKDSRTKLSYQKPNLNFIKNKNIKQHQHNKPISNQIKENCCGSIDDLTYQKSITLKCDDNPNFQFSLDQTDMDICRNTAYQMNKIRQSIIIDIELATHLNLLALSSEQVLFNQQRNAFIFYEQMKQLEIANWLNTKSDQERKLYLERTQQI